MAFAWRTTDEFCPIWSAAKPRSARTVTAVGDYPSDRRQPFKTTEPVLANVLKAKARQNEIALPVLSSAAAPPAVPKPPVELLPSTEARYPRSLSHWNPVQIDRVAWSKPDISTIWNVVIQRTVRTNFPEHELRGLKPRVWRRGLNAPKHSGLQSAPTLTLTIGSRRPAGLGDVHELMRPNWREARIQDSADAPRIQAASLARTVAIRRWQPIDTPQSSVAPLRLLAPNFAVSVPDPKPLR